MADTLINQRAPLDELPANDAGYAETLKNKLTQGVLETPVLSELLGFERNIEEYIDQGPRITPEELNQKYLGRGIEFKFPMSDIAAQELISRKQVRASLEQRINQGPDNALMSVLGFGAAMLPQIADPANLAASAFVGATGVFAKLAGNRSSTIVAKELAENFVGNILVEPVVMARENTEGREYTAAQAFINSLGGAVLGTGLKYGLGAIGSKISGKGWRGHLAAQQMAMAQLLNGKKVDISEHINMQLDEITPRRIEPFERLDITQPLKDKTFFAAVDANSKTDSIGDDFGEGVYLTTNARAANGAAASTLNDAVGFIREVRAIDDLKLLDLDNQIDDSIRTILPDIKKAETLRDYLGKLREDNPAKLSEVSQKLKSAGYDGYYHDNRLTMEQTGREENVVILFGEEKLEKIQEVAGDQSKLYRPSKEKLLSIAKNEEARGDSPFILENKDLDPASQERLARELTIDEDYRNLDSEFDNFEKEAQALLNEKILSEEEFQIIKESKTNTEDISKALEAAFRCMAGGL